MHFSVQAREINTNEQDERNRKGDWEVEKRERGQLDAKQGRIVKLDF